MQKPSGRLTFYVSLDKEDNRFQELVEKLEEYEVDYDVFTDPSIIVPLMAYSGRFIGGFDNISNELTEFLSM